MIKEYGKTSRVWKTLSAGASSIFYKPVSSNVANDEGLIPKASTYDYNGFVLKIEVEPETKILTIDYYTLYNFLIIVGGLSESITMICMVFMPILFVVFLRKLASIIQQKKKEDYKQNVIK